MWLAFNDAFISAVEDRNDPTRLVVRARNPEHLKGLFPSHDIVVTPKADYIARAFVTREEFTRVLVERVAEIRYDNFKASVTDERLHRLYENMWYLHHAYQENSSKPDRSRHFAWSEGDVRILPKRD